MVRALIILGVMSVFTYSVSPLKASQENESVSEVTLEMTEGLANARAFKIVLRKDGTALYHGMANVPLIGKYKGSITSDDFNNLVAFLSVRKFNKLKSTMGSATTATIAVSAPVVMTSVVEGGKRRTITRAYRVKVNNPDAPAKELLEIENAITAVAVRIKWEKPK